MSVVIGAVLYVSSAALLTVASAIRCRHSPGRLSYLFWPWFAGSRSPEFWSRALAGAMGLVAVVLLPSNDDWPIGLPCLAGLIAVQLAPVVLHNRSVAHAEAWRVNPGLHPERSLTGPNSAL